MTTLRKKAEKIRVPGRTLLLETWVWADSWERKPKEKVCVGIRLLSESEQTTARSESAALARQLHPEGGSDQIDCFNDSLMRWLVATAACDPNDIERPAPVFGAACDEELVRVAMSSKGVRYVFDSVLKYEVETGSLYPEIEDSEFVELGALLAGGALERLPAAARSTARRHLLFALDALRQSPAAAAAE